MQRGPYVHRMDAPSDVTGWAVIKTTRQVVKDDGRGMTLRDEWWEVPTFVVDAIEREAATTPDGRARLALAQPAEPSGLRAAIERARRQWANLRGL
jgi:hypothetical protein